MAIDWSKLNELEDNGTAEGAAKQDKLVAVPSPKEQEQEPASLGSSSAIPDPRLVASKIAVQKYTDLLKGSSDFVLDVGEHIISTNPLDQIAGVAEAGAELTIGFAGAGLGVLAGADTALTLTEKKQKELLQERYGHEDAIIKLNEVSTSAKVYLAVFNEVSEALIYQPRTETGKAISNFVQTIFQKFGDWGKDSRSFSLANDLGPEVSTAIETLIAGTPYIVPPILAKGKIAAGIRAKARADKIKVKKIEELAKEEILDVIPESKLILKNTSDNINTLINQKIENLNVKNRTIDFENIKQTLPPEKINHTRLYKASSPTQKFKDVFNADALTEFNTKRKGKMGDFYTKDLTYADYFRDAYNAKKDAIIEYIDIKDTLLKDRNIGGGEYIIDQKTLRLNKGKLKVEQTNKVLTDSANKVRAEYDKAILEKERIEAKERKSIISKFKTGVLDVSAEVKQRLFKQGEQVGEAAAMRHDLIAGATTRAQIRFQKWDDRIYSNITKKDFSTINEIIQSRRIIEIDILKGEGVTRHPGKLTGKDHSNALLMLNEKLGSKKFNELWTRTDQYFRATNEVLVDLYTNGLIDKAAFKSMKDVVYEPRKFLSKLDPSRPQKLGNQTINVHDSGLRDLGRGAIKSLEQDSRALLSEYIVRAENRIARNKANRSLLDFAELYPENGWVKSIKVKKHTAKGKAGKVVIPQGQVRIDTMIDGKVRPMLMDKHMAEQWITQSPQVTANMANFMRVTSGSFIVRPLATGYNPGFALVNFVRDIAHAYMASSEFSIHLPKFGAQMTRDLAVTAKDAWKKKGRFEDAINEGLGMNFLTHQGTESFIMKGVGPSLTPRWRHIKENMSKLNDFSEVWVRLAIRDQALRNGKTPEQATHAARNVLDFSQGGRYAKSIDHSIPYLNASIQAFRTTAREAARKPKEFAVKIAWLQATAGTLWLSNYYANREAWEQTSSDMRNKNWLIGTGLDFIDQQGNKRHLFIPIKKDNTMIFFTSLPEMLLERYYEGRVPDRALLKSTLESLPAGSKLPIPPSLSAAMAYRANYDFWTDDNIWKGPEVEPEEEFNIAPKKPTPTFFRDVGKWTGLSPIRTEAAVKNLVPQNPYTNLMGMGYKMLTEGLSDFDKSKTTIQILEEIPMLNRMIYITHPLSREKAFAEKTIKEGNGFRLDIDRNMDNIYFRLSEGSLTGGQGTIRTWINAQPQQERERLTKRLETMRTYDRIMSRDMGVQGVPSRGTWVNWNTVDGITRADLFYWKWRNANAKGRAKMESIAGRMSAQGLGFRSDSFNRRFRKNLNTYGRDYFGDGESREAKIIPRR